MPTDFVQKSYFFFNASLDTARGLLARDAPLQGLYEYMNIILFEKADEVTFSEGFIIMPVNLQNHKDNAKCSVRTSILYPSVLPPALKQVESFIKPSQLSKIKNNNIGCYLLTR